MHDCDALEKCTRVVRVSDDSSVEVSLSEDKETIRDSPLLFFFLFDQKCQTGGAACVNVCV